MEQLRNQAQASPLNLDSEFSKSTKLAHKSNAKTTDSAQLEDTSVDFKTILEQSLQNPQVKIAQKLDSTSKAKDALINQPAGYPLNATKKTSLLSTQSELGASPEFDSLQEASATKQTPSSLKLLSSAQAQKPSNPILTNVQEDFKALSQPKNSRVDEGRIDRIIDKDITLDGVLTDEKPLQKLPVNLAHTNVESATESKVMPQIKDVKEPRDLKDSTLKQGVDITDKKIAKDHIPSAPNPTLAAQIQNLQSTQENIQNTLGLQDQDFRLSDTDFSTSKLPQKMDSQTLSESQNKLAPRLSDVVQKAQDLNLNPKNVKFEQIPASSTKIHIQDEEALSANTKTPQATTQPGDIKQFFDKQDEEALRPLFFMLDSINQKDANQRRMNATRKKIEYIFEGKSEKIAVIHRSKVLPKNIVDSRLQNAKQERVFEQIQRDLIAGKELDLDQIRRDLESSPIQEESILKIGGEIKSTPKPLGLSQSIQSAPDSLTQAPLVKTAKQGDLGKNDRQDKQDQKGDQNSNNASKDSQSQELSKSQTQASKSLQEGVLQQDEILFQENGKQASLNNENAAQKLQDLSPAKQEQASKAESRAEAKTINTAISSAHIASNTQKLDSRNINMREVISSFAWQLNEEVKNFKPPINRLSMELTPKELGSIELTFTQQGKNIHISVISNPQAINLFAQNQTDLRQGLLNVGFSGVDLSFSSNDNKGSNQQHSSQNTQPQYQEYEDMADLPYDTMEITFPQYA